LNIAGTLINSRYFVERALPSRFFTRDWLARSVSSNVPVHLKFLPSPDDALPAARLERFRAHWARLVEVLDPAVERIYEVAGFQGYTFAAAEQIQGSRLAEYLRAFPALPLEEVVHLVLLAARALESLHPLGLVHKSLGPESLWVLEHYDRIQSVKLGDFCTVEQELLARGGLGRLARSRFIAPEVITAPASARASADLFSLGRILHWLLARGGRSPAPTAADRARAATLRRIVDTAMAPEPAKRYQLPAELIEELTRVLSGSSDERQAEGEDARPSRRSTPALRQQAPKRAHRKAVSGKAGNRLKAAEQPRTTRKRHLPSPASRAHPVNWGDYPGSFQRLFLEVLRGRGGLYRISRRRDGAYPQKARILDYYKYYAAYQGGAMLSVPANKARERHFLFQKLLEPVLVRTRLLRRKDWQEAQERFRAAFHDRAAALRAVHPGCASFFAPGREARECTGMAMRSLFLEYLRFFLRLRSPLIVVVREVQLLDRDSRRLLEGCRSELPGLPVLVLGIGED